MTRRVRRGGPAVSVVLLTALALTGPACRGGGRTASPETSVAASTLAPPNEELCRDARAFVTQIVQLAQPDWNKDRLRALYENLDGFLRRASELVPEGLRTATTLAADVLSAFRTSLETVDYDLGRVDPAAWARVNSPEFSAAVGGLADYSRRTCGLPS